MNPRKTKVGYFFAGLLLLAVSAPLPADEPVDPNLTPRLRQLLVQEMRSILQASQALTSALVSGQHQQVATLANSIHESFILKQSLTEQDRQDLMKAVPPAFVELDRAFHHTAAKLARAAEQRDIEMEHTQFQDLIGQCIECHRRYVHDRFPGFRTGSARP